MKKFLSSVILLLFFILGGNSLKAQFPALEISADMVSAASGSTVDVSVRAGQNWQNITTLNGTITFDTTVITYNSMVFWGLSFPQGATFTYLGGGVLTWTWTSLITIGPTLMAGDPVFTLRFNVVGAGGTSSPVTMGSTPQAFFWANGFGWSGTNFSQTNGLVTVTCGQPTSSFSSSDSLLTVNFSDNSSGGATSYFWDFGDGNTSTQANPSHTYASSGSYTVCQVVTNSCGTDSMCQQVNICSSVFASMTTPPSTVCVGDTVSLSSNGTGGSSFAWKLFGQTFSTQQNAVYIPSGIGNDDVYLVVSDGSCSDSTLHIFNVGSVNVSTTGGAPQCPGDPNSIIAFNSTPSPTAFTWDQGLGSGSTQTISPLIATTYNVVGIDSAGCSDSASITVGVLPLPPIDGGADDTVCVGEPFSLTATGAPFYQWMSAGQFLGNNPTITDTIAVNTLYEVTGVSNDGCSAIDSVLVTALALPNVIASPNTAICSGAFTNIAVTGNAQTYVWNQGLGTGMAWSVIPSATTTYSVTGTDANGCSATDSVTVTVNPAMIADAGPDIDICEGDSTTLMGIGFGGQGTFSFLWQPGNFAGALYTVSPSQTTTFALTAIDANGCSGTDSVTVNYHPNPVALFSSTSTGLTTLFTDMSTGNITSWQWDFGDGNSSTMQSPAHTYAMGGNYTVTLTVTTIWGCSGVPDTNTVSVLVANDEPFAFENEMAVYPNPTQGKVHLKVNQGEIIARIKISDMTGKAFSLIEGEGGVEQILDLSLLPAGLYLVEVETDKGMKIGKVVLQ